MITEFEESTLKKSVHFFYENFIKTISHQIKLAEMLNAKISNTMQRGGLLGRASHQN